MIKFLFTSIAVLALVFNVSAQSTVQLNINHLLGEEIFNTTEVGENNLGNEFKIGRLQYFISGITLIHDGGNETYCDSVYLYVDASMEGKFILGDYGVNEIEGIRFHVGVNAPANNHDPTQWPEGHALAPKFPSMHWGWAAGYRFVALEGKSGDSFVRTYEIHALGNDNYFACQLPVEATDENGFLVIELNADYAKGLNNIDVSKGVVTHGDYNEAVTLLENYANYVFTNQNGETNVLSTTEYAYNESLIVYPNPAQGNVSIQFNEQFENENLNLIISDLNGRSVQRIPLNGDNLNLSLEAGFYFAKVERKGEVLAVKRVIIQ
ncbi:MAG: T9SS type A sorting domain-containing protein [Bacteroidia bacterium]